MANEMKATNLKPTLQKGMTFNLRVWRQAGPDAPGKLVDYKIENITGDVSFLEMLDILNEQLIKQGIEPVEFDNDCREGICGMCGLVINGQPHGPQRGTTTCELYMRHFKDGQTITIEPWRARAFPVLRDLVVDRTAFDRIMSAGGYISVNSGPHPDANSHLINRDDAESSMDAAACIGCGACVAACPNASSALFTGAAISKYALLPQGQPERWIRVREMVEQMDAEGFGHCSNIGECSSACPKSIKLTVIARMKSDYLMAMAKTCCSQF